MPLPEKTLRNKAIISLFICGFSQRQIARLLSSKRGNVQMFIRRDTEKYAGEVLDNISRYITKRKVVKPTNQYTTE